ncbi:MAG: 2-amino-4-hydroxy-6-hydroxymethyldihydropteridine diphosphokinase [Sulfitobacter sp.]|nr:2-amino-4-hydroxy-6-hydroxymethyldihydropteridine diphosphokinase [Sulfitobacter sp.]
MFGTLVALGANLASPHGGPAETLAEALRRLAGKGAVIRYCSFFYSTPAFPAGNGPNYVNAAVRLETNWGPEETLANLHEIEAGLGRARERRWGQRTLDLDLIALDDLVLPDRATHDHWRALPLQAQQKEVPPELILPHPRLQERAFVLVPLADVAPDWVHPILGHTVEQMRDALPKERLAEVVRLDSPLVNRDEGA